MHLGKGSAGIEDIPCDIETIAATDVRIELQHPSGQPQCLLTQVRRGIRIVLQYLHHVARLEHRTDTASHRLAAIGDDHLNEQAQPAGDVFEQLAQCLRLAHVANLGRRSHRDVDNEVCGSRGDFF